MSLSARRLGAVVCKSLAIVEVDTSRRSAISRCVRPSPRRLRTWAARASGAKRPLRGRLATARRISLARRVRPPPRPSPPLASAPYRASPIEAGPRAGDAGASPRRSMARWPSRRPCRARRSVAWREISQRSSDLPPRGRHTNPILPARPPSRGPTRPSSSRCGQHSEERGRPRDAGLDPVEALTVLV